MSDIILLYATAPDRAAAEKIARALIEENAAACINIIDGMSSIYRWRGEIETANEFALFIKTTRAKAPLARKIMVAKHPYENPALLALPVDRRLSSEAFCAWIENSA